MLSQMLTTRSSVNGCSTPKYGFTRGLQQDNETAGSARSAVVADRERLFISDRARTVLDHLYHDSYSAQMYRVP
jgi:hypothetical protein